MPFLREQLKDVFVVFYQKTKKWDALCVFTLVFSMFSSLALQCSHGWFLSPRVLHSLVETDMLPCCIFLVWGNCYPLELEWAFPLFIYFLFFSFCSLSLLSHCNTVLHLLEFFVFSFVGFLSPSKGWEILPKISISNF